MKKILLTLLALLMVFGMMMPISAEEDSENVAKIGDVNYSSLEEALNAAKTGETVTLLNNVTESVVIEAGKSIVLDLNGKTITNVEGKHTITNKGTLTIKGEGAIDNVSHQKGALVNEGTAIIENGNFTRSKEAGSSTTVSGGNSWYVIQNKQGGKMTFNGGNITSKGKYSSLVDNYGTMTINDGNFSNGFIAIKSEEGTQLEINGGEIKGVQSIQTYGDTVINDGKLEGQISVINYQNFPSNTEIKGGDIKGDVVAWLDSNNSNVKVDFEGEAKVTGELKVWNSKKEEIEENENVDINVESGSFSSDISKYTSENTSLIGVDGTYHAGSEEKLQEKAKEAKSLVEVIKGIEELNNIPANVKVENKTDKEIIVNNEKLEAGKDVVVKSNEKPSTPSCAGKDDKNCDGVVTCEEEKGKGWIWNNTKKVCEYNPNAYTVVNTGVK